MWETRQENHPEQRIFEPLDAEEAPTWHTHTCQIPVRHTQLDRETCTSRWEYGV